MWKLNILSLLFSFHLESVKVQVEIDPGFAFELGNHYFGYHSALTAGRWYHWQLITRASAGWVCTTSHFQSPLTASPFAHYLLDGSPSDTENRVIDLTPKWVNDTLSVWQQWPVSRKIIMNFSHLLISLLGTLSV